MENDDYKKYLQQIDALIISGKTFSENVSEEQKINVAKTIREKIFDSEYANFTPHTRRSYLYALPLVGDELREEIFHLIYESVDNPSEGLNILYNDALNEAMILTSDINLENTETYSQIKHIAFSIQIIHQEGVKRSYLDLMGVLSQKSSPYISALKSSHEKQIDFRKRATLSND